jgi:phage-related tail protein
LESELNSYKEKWASTQCDLQDCEANIKTVEKERDRALTLLNKTLQALETERTKVKDLEDNVEENHFAANLQTTSKNVSLLLKACMII